MQNSNMNKDLLPPGYRPISLPRQNAVVVSALTALQGTSIELHVGPETWRMRFSGRPGPAAGTEARVRAVWQGHRVNVRFPQVLLHRTLHLCQPGLSLQDIPPPLWPAMAGNLLGAWLTGLPHAQSLHIDSMEAGNEETACAGEDAAHGPDAPHGAQRIYLIAQRISPVPEDALEYAIAVDLDPALLSALPRMCHGLSSGSPALPRHLLDLPLPLRCEVGQIAVPCATLKALRLGDILFFDSHSEDLDDPSGIAMQLTHRGCMLLRTRLHSPDLMVVTETDMNDRKSFFYDDLLEESELDLLGAANSHDFEEDTSLETAAAGSTQSDRGGRDSLSQLPLQLVFDIGDCEMRLCELQALQVGSVIPLAASKTEMVRVRVNGRVVASGELVEIDGKIGVMLARLADIQ
ncbi:MAG TPA: type III secretion system cytoplasmic ring protein SctQ [Herbaspirillum sp.]|jgi:type III secretion system YscQ/HrcQ family protein